MNIEEPTSTTAIVEEGYLRWREDLQYGECEDCMFFFIEQDAIQGSCKRYPPTVRFGRSGGVLGISYPSLFKTDGCGEFRKRKEK